MPYYPKHFIKTNLYTNGNEFQYKGTNTPYVGYYWKAGNGRFFDGKTPQQTTNLEIVPIEEVNNQTSTQLTDTPAFYPKSRISIQGDSPDIDVDVNVDEVNNYLRLTSQEKSINLARLLPINNPQLPTEQDYVMGEMRRYFCKKTNEIQYFEIEKDFYTKLVNKDPKVVWELYIAFNIPWEISGDENVVKQTNQNIVANISRKLRLPKFGDFINNNYIKYYK